MSSISLTSSMRSNLSSLRAIGLQMDKTQERLSSGLKVNSAIDNASSYYQVRSLTNRAADLDALLDAMGQGIQTIQAAVEGLESGAAFLEQATAVATQTLTDSAASEKTTNYYESQGYTAITSTMDARDIKKLLDNGVKKFVLDGEVSLTEELVITQQDIVIEGNGNRITFGGADSSTVKAAIKVDGGSLDIKNLYMTISGKNNFGIQAINSGVVTIDNTDGIEVLGDAKKIATSTIPDLYDGKNNTAIVKALDDDFSDFAAFKAATSYSAVSGDEGKWYLPSIGELVQAQNNKVAINEGLASIAGSDAFETGYVWSSSESNDSGAWEFSIKDGKWLYTFKDRTSGVRAFQFLENCINPSILSVGTSDTGSGEALDLVGQIMYQNGDKYYWGDTGTGGTAIGVITNVSATGDVTIMSLNNSGSMVWRSTKTNVDTLPDDKDASVLNNSGTIKSSFTAFDYKNEKAIDGSVQFKEIINQYDKLVNDTSYQGINLLKGGKLDVTFNETRSKKFTIFGKDVSSAKLNLTTLKWERMDDVADAVKEIAAAMSQIRSMSSELGNSYSIIQTRQSFTDALTDILSEGADKLMLADMNEESANYLALQTRQQLAVNSLSLAAQSAQSVMSLF